LGSATTEFIGKMDFREIGREGGRWLELLHNFYSSKILMGWDGCFKPVTIYGI
jgi:hypothetical protein